MSITMGFALGACSVDRRIYVSDAPPQDDAPAAVTLVISASDLTVDEAAQRTFTVALSHPPPSAMLVNLTASSDIKLAVSPSSLVFQPADATTPQVVTVTGREDDDAADELERIDVLTAEASAALVNVTVDDNDVLGIVTTPSTGIDVTEGSTASFAVRLRAQPADTLQITLVSSNPLAATLAPTLLTFTTENWNVDQLVTVSGVDDVDTSTDLANVAIAGAGLAEASVVIAVPDDDVLGIEPSSTNLGSLNEGTTSSFTVRLSHRPPADVTVAVDSSDAAAVAVSQSRLTFTAANWDTPQTVDLTVLQDVDAAGASASISLTATGLTTRVVAVAIQDDDTLGIESSSNTANLGEGGSATFQVRLTAMPPSDVIIGVSSDDTSAATVSTSSLSFTPGNWNTFQPVTVTGTEDIDLVNESVLVTMSAAGLTGRTLTASVTDNDTQQILVSIASVGVNEGGNALVGVSLKHQPATVTSVSVTSTSTAIATVSPALLTFTPANFAIAQNLTVTGAQDANASNDSTTISLTALATIGATIAAAVTDDDTVSIVVSTAALTVSESGSGAFSVRLAAQPAGAVVVALASGDTGAANVSPALLTFTTADWDVDKVVAVTGVADNDLADETVSLTCSSTGLINRVVTATVLDDDTQEVVVNPTSLTVDEGSTATFAVTLRFIPSGIVSVNVASDNPESATVSPTSLIFTAADHAMARTVTVTGIDDSSSNGHDIVSITASAPGALSGTVDVLVLEDDPVPICGNRIRESGEVCDDGNATCGSCSPDCQRITLAPATGQIVVPPAGGILEGDTLTVSDGLFTMTFTFVNDLPGLAEIRIEPNGTQMAFNIANSINVNLALFASTSGNVVSLVNFRSTSLGNVPIAANVSSGQFAVSGMSGGEGGDCQAGEVCKTDDDCASDLCRTDHVCL